MPMLLTIIWLFATELPLTGALVRVRSAGSDADEPSPDSRGIVMSCPAAQASFSAGEWKPSELFKGFTTAAMGLRKMGCQLPIYNVVYTDELTHITQRCQELNQHLGGVTCVAMPRDDVRGYGYSKIFAVKHAPVSQVMFLDCDAFFVRDPTYMFNDSSFIATGALFWADIEGHFASEGFMTAGMEWLPEEKKIYSDKWWFRQGYDTGLLLVNKPASKERLDFLLEMVTSKNDNSQKPSLLAISRGEKDLWHLAWIAKGPPCTDTVCSLMPFVGTVGKCPQEGEDDPTCHICSQAKQDRQGDLLLMHQIWPKNERPIAPSTLISVNIVGKGAADAQGPHPNDNFYGFYDAISISYALVKEKFSEGLREVPSNIQKLVDETYACWHYDAKKCTLSSI